MNSSDLSNTILINAKFDYAILSGANFEGADITRARFFAAKMLGALLDNVDLTSADFRRAMLSGRHTEQLRKAKEATAAADPEPATTG